MSYKYNSIIRDLIDVVDSVAQQEKYSNHNQRHAQTMIKLYEKLKDRKCMTLAEHVKSRLQTTEPALYEGYFHPRKLRE